MVLRHTIYNLLGLGVPLIAAVFSIPILIEVLGTERFGLLTLIWAVVSYFGLFDLGLGLAMTQQLAVVFARNDEDKVGPLVATSCVLMLGLGAGAGSLLALLAPLGVEHLTGVPNPQEAINAVYVLACSMPAVVLTSGLRGILVAKRSFGIVNLIRLPMGLWTFLGPLAVVFFGSARLDWIAAALAAGRVVACFGYGFFAWRELPEAHGRMHLRFRLFRSLYETGGWMTVSNIVSPLMGYIDRFFIGVLVSATAVAYFATPQELVTKIWILPGALTTVLFPSFAEQISKRDGKTWGLFKESIYWLFVLLLPVTTALAIFSHELLTYWIDPDFASHSAMLLQIFSFGILINCMAHVPFTLIQSAGRARLTALVHLVEVPGFVVVLWWLTSTHGAFGAALAWLFRLLVDTLLMFALGVRLLERPVKMMAERKIVLLGLLAIASFSGVWFQSIEVRMIWWLSFSLFVFIVLIKPRVRDLRLGEY